MDLDTDPIAYDYGTLYIDNTADNCTDETLNYSSCTVDVEFS